MEIVYAVGIVSAVVVILILAYLYRESAAISGKGQVQVGPVKVELEDQAQKGPDMPSPDAPKSIEDSLPELGMDLPGDITKPPR